MLAESLRAEFVFFSVNASSGQPRRSIGNGMGRIDSDALDVLCAQGVTRIVVRHRDR